VSPRPARALFTGGLAVLLVIGLALLLPRLLLPGDPPAVRSDGQPALPTAPPSAPGERARLGLHTGLPLYRPLGIDVEAMARGQGEVPWQRRALEKSHALVPLDTLSPTIGLVPGDPPVDPLEGLDRLAVIQPRALSPADNVALDEWVKAGGQLLLVLDPMLTGEYDLPLGDPRHPNSVALIPPVVERWGLQIVYDETQESGPRFASHEGGTIPLALAGEVRALRGRDKGCTFAASRALARCRVGEGSVTVLADAAVFEHESLAAEAGQGRSAIGALVDYAFASGKGGDRAGKPRGGVGE